MSDKQAHLAEFFQKGSRAKVGDGDTEESLPGCDSTYEPFARRSNKPEFSLHFITAAGTMRSFQYAHLDSDSTFTAECITLRFMGIEAKKVLIHGRNLRQLYDYIHQHRTAWIREAHQPFVDDDGAIVRKVKIEALKDAVKEDVAGEAQN